VIVLVGEGSGVLLGVGVLPKLASLGRPNGISSTVITRPDSTAATKNSINVVFDIVTSFML